MGSVSGGMPKLTGNSEKEVKGQQRLLKIFVSLSFGYFTTELVRHEKLYSESGLYIEIYDQLGVRDG